MSEDLAPRVSGLQQVVTEEFGQLRGESTCCCPSVRSGTKTKNPPVDWAALTAEQAAVQWPILARWVGEVLVPRYELTRDELPDCWALHPPVVAELSWLRTAYVQAYLTQVPAPAGRGLAHPVAAGGADPDPGAGQRPTSAFPVSTRRGAARPSSWRRQNGALPRTQLAEPQCWWPFYDRAYHLDLALRRARAPRASSTGPRPGERLSRRGGSRAVWQTGLSPSWRSAAAS